MSAKTVPFKKPGRKVDQWVETGQSNAAPEQTHIETKRFTFDVPVDLHRRIKVQCALRGLKMAELVREMLEKKFPAEAEKAEASGG